MGDKIVAPITYVFDEIDRYTIKCFHAYRAQAGQGQFKLAEDFFRVASDDKRSYLVLTDHHLRDLRLANPRKGDRHGNYIYLGMYGSFYGFKHI